VRLLALGFSDGNRQANAVKRWPLVAAATVGVVAVIGGVVGAYKWWANRSCAGDTASISSISSSNTTTDANNTAVGTSATVTANVSSTMSRVKTAVQKPATATIQLPAIGSPNSTAASTNATATQRVVMLLTVQLLLLMLMSS
jgi:hypothetical protein